MIFWQLLLSLIALIFAAEQPKEENLTMGKYDAIECAKCQTKFNRLRPDYQSLVTACMMQYCM